jgi:quinolinate synthase
MVSTLVRTAKSRSVPSQAPIAVPAYTWSKALEAEMAPLYQRVRHIVTPMEWPHYAPLIKAINELKTQRNAVILAHNYMTP